MDVQDLTEHEQLVLIGLVKLIVHADQHVSPEERAVLRTLQAAMGDERWNALVQAAATQFTSIAALEQAAHLVESPDAQHLIHDLLSELAGSDEVIPAEAHVLQWIDQTWSLSAPEPDDAEDEDDDNNPVESFVLIDDA